MTLITLPCGFGVLRTGTGVDEEPTGRREDGFDLHRRSSFFLGVVVVVVRR